MCLMYNHAAGHEVKLKHCVALFSVCCCFSFLFKRLSGRYDVKKIQTLWEEVSVIGFGTTFEILGSEPWSCLLSDCWLLQCSSPEVGFIYLGSHSYYGRMVFLCLSGSIECDSRPPSMWHTNSPSDGPGAPKRSNRTIINRWIRNQVHATKMLHLFHRARGSRGKCPRRLR
jgi:hypothetical protein